MEKAVHRIFEYLRIKGIRHTRFEKEIGLSNGYLNTQLKRGAGMGEDVLNKVVDGCEDIDPEWLLTGRGEMFRHNSKEKREAATSSEVNLAQNNWITIQKMFGRIAKLESEIDELKENNGSSASKRNIR